MLVVEADDLGEQIEAPTRLDHVGDLVELGEGFRDLRRIAVDPHADHGHALEAEPERIGDGHDLHDALVDQALDPLADRGLGQPTLLAIAV